MNRLALLLALSSGTTVTAVAWAVLQPPRLLRGRVRPYAPRRPDPPSTQRRP